MQLYQCYAFRLTKYVLLATEGLLSYDMRVLDFFNNKKKENTRQEQLRLQQEEKRRAEVLNRLEGQRKLAEQQKREESFLSNFNFDSTCHQRYENNQPVRKLQVCVTTQHPYRKLLVNKA